MINFRRNCRASREEEDCCQQLSYDRIDMMREKLNVQRLERTRNFSCAAFYRFLSSNVFFVFCFAKHSSRRFIYRFGMVSIAIVV